MPPAFSSTKQAAAFALLLLFLLAAPWLANKTFLPERGKTYSSQSIRWEKFPWVQKFIFEETNDIDIAFIGSSHLGAGIDTPYVQQKLSERLGHEAVCRSIYYSSQGFDSLYFFTQELLSHRKVKTLVFYDECSWRFFYRIHTFAPFWFRYGDNGGVMSGLPLGYQGIYYFAAMIGMPRNLLELLVPCLPNDPHSQAWGPFAFWPASNPELTLGCIGLRLRYDHNTNFSPYIPKSNVSPKDICIFSPVTASNFVFSDRSLPVTQTYFAQQFGALAKKHGCNLVALHMPLFDETASSIMKESRKWPDLLQDEVCMMGIPGERLFNLLKEPDLEKLFADPDHLNLNGQKYFTSLVTPALIDYYESHSHR